MIKSGPQICLTSTFREAMFQILRLYGLHKSFCKLTFRGDVSMDTLSTLMQFTVNEFQIPRMCESGGAQNPSFASLGKTHAIEPQLQ